MQELIEEAICHENMAFILVPHLSRDHETALPSILDRFTDLKIKTIEHNTTLERCHLYILPPKFYARLEKDRLVLDPRPPKGINHAADILFKSLAEYHQRNAIGVVLSGAAVGADGSEGIVAIKNCGGHTYAQTPETAEYPQMPEAAIATGAVDSILPARAIGHELTLVSWVGAGASV